MRYGTPPFARRSQNTTWKEFISAHMAVLTGADFFAAEVLTWRGRVTYYALFFSHLEIRRVTLASKSRGIAPKRGWPRWPATPSMRRPTHSVNVGIAP
jgi:hypothetical protein